ncbi:MAG: bifunctional hexulose-6-phosphate synthase/ribonuclease regulator [Elusimicrobia bacterium RIFOXYA2_FULL_39_19]|nr:MAG: bifunctional hexulose-6-phosphate synthase/ribonuclease regulator [Elusimicrobia bacterium RIFOXYA2_FULL_39_19]
MEINKPILQVALDFVDLKRAITLAGEALSGGCDWIEAGTPLIKSEGLNSIRELRRNFPQAVIVADMKIMDVGRTEVEIAAKAGANIVCVLGCAHIETIKECVEAGKNYGAKIMIDLLEVKNPTELIKTAEKIGVDYIGVHIPIDEQMTGKISFEMVSRIAKITKLPIAIAGGINSSNAADAVKAGASIIIAGGSITKSTNAKKAASEIKRAITNRIKIKSQEFNRVKTHDVLDALNKVSVANISDAMHRGLPVNGLKPLFTPVKFSGKAITVRTCPGDWAKPVQAIDLANPGDVIVIDAAGAGPAVWGELATTSAMQKKIAGVIVYGAIRDVADIRKLKFPAFASVITPQAGEPKGLGEINVPITISGIKIMPGDWIMADDDGVMVIPRDTVVETANRAMDILERENRLRVEIKRGSTLSKVTNLLKWEKKSGCEA